MKSLVEPDRTNIPLSVRKADKANAAMTGWFFIAATVSAIIGAKLYDPLLTTTEYLNLGAAHSGSITLGAVFELVLVVAACATAIMLYPHLKVYNERLALGYFCFRMLEAVMILLGIVSVLALLTLSHSYTTIPKPENSVYSAIGTVLKAFHDWTFILGPKLLLGINTLTYSYVFYKTGLVPRQLSLLGITGACLVFVNALLEMFGVVGSSSAGDLLLAFPVAIYEMVLAGWLITRGFNIQHTT